MRVESAAIEISRPQWWRRALVALVALEAASTATLLLAGGLLTRVQRDELFFYTFYGAWACAAAFGIGTRRPTLGSRNGGGAGTITVRDDIVTVEAPLANLTVSRARITGSTLVQQGDRFELVFFVDDGTRVAAIMSDRELARRLAEELGTAPEKRAIELELSPVEGRIARGLLGVVFILALPTAVVVTLAAVGSLLSGGWDTMFAMAIVGPLAWLFTITSARALGHTTVRIGGDGIAVRGLVRRRFFPHDTTRVFANGNVVELMEGAKTHRVRTSSAHEATAVVDRIRASRGAAGETTGAVLLRSGRDVAAWRAHLQTMMRDASAYRAQLTVEQLVTALEDPREEAEARIGAALALVADEEHRVRVDRAIAGTANPQLRVAFERAATGTLDEDTLRAATERG